MKLHPMQDIVITKDKVVRFRQNELVRYLVDFAKLHRPLFKPLICAPKLL